MYFPAVRAIVVIALHTGMRLGEILNLRDRDLDFGSGLILIPDSKNGEPRHIRMDSTVASLLTHHPRRPGSDLVFKNKTGGRFLEIRGGFKNACERAGVLDLHFHDLLLRFALDDGWRRSLCPQEHSGSQIDCDDATVRSLQSGVQARGRQSYG